MTNTVFAADLRHLIETVAPALGADESWSKGVSLGRIALSLQGGTLRAQASDRYVILRNRVPAEGESAVKLYFTIPTSEVKELVAALRKLLVVTLTVEEDEVVLRSPAGEIARLPTGGAPGLWKTFSKIQYAPGEQAAGQNRSVVPIARLHVVLTAAKKVSAKGSLVESLPGYIRSPLRFVHTESEHWEAIVVPDQGTRSVV